MMTVLPLAKIGKVLNRPHYIEEAKRQFLIHIKYLFDTKTGLFFHGWTFEDGGHNFAKALWGRGNRYLVFFFFPSQHLIVCTNTTSLTAGSPS